MIEGFWWCLIILSWSYYVYYLSFVYLGTGEHASQQGMNIGGIRHASDIKADDMTLQSQGMLHPQTGMLFFVIVVICICIAALLFTLK